MKLLQQTLDAIRPADPELRRQAEERVASFVIPPGSLGRLTLLAVELVAMTGQTPLDFTRKRIVLLAGDHGIVAEGVCPQPSSITAQAVRNFARGGGTVNLLARNAGAEVTVVDLGVDDDFSDLVKEGLMLDRKIARGTANFAAGPAMSRDEAVRALETGIEVAEHLAPHTDLFGTGEMGIGNTSPSSAILTVLARAPHARPYVGIGAGLAAAKLDHKAAAIQRGIDRNRPDPADPVDVLAKVGGFEIGGIAGLILGAARLRRPVVVDGFISSAGALLAAALSPASCDYMILAHGSAEPGHKKMAELLGKAPLFDLGMRLGEGTGAALAMNLVDAAALLYNEEKTFEDAEVSSEGLK